MRKIIKNIVKLTALIIMSAAALNCSAQNNTLSLKVTNLKPGQGKVLIALMDNNDPATVISKMIALDGKKKNVKCVLENVPEGIRNLYIFQDLNGDYNLDLNEKGIPVEGCFSGKVDIRARRKRTEAMLEYYAEK